MPVDVGSLSKAIIIEILGVMGLKQYAWARWLATLVFGPAVRKFSTLLSAFDQDVAWRGWQAATAALLPRFVTDFRAHGLEHLPRDGPLVLAANHPAAYDLLILSATLPRDDLKIISSTIHAISYLPSVAPHFIPITPDPHHRMQATRSALSHLQQGGALLVFARGEVEPDPAVYPGAQRSIELWSNSLELFWRNVRNTEIVISMVSGVLSECWFNNVVPRLWKKPEQRHKIAEIFQTIQQILQPGSLHLQPEVYFTSLVSSSRTIFTKTNQSQVMEDIRQQARNLISHLPYK